MRIRALLAAALGCAVLAATVAPADAGLPEEERQRPLPVPTTDTVTADQLGPGSVLAVISRGNFEKVRATDLGRSLEVITADGVRHRVYSVDVDESDRGWYRGDFTLADWRPDTHTALLSVSLGSAGFKAVAYDVVTGALHEVPLPQKASTLGLDPDGTGVVMTTYPTQRRSGRVLSLGWDGTTTDLTGRSDGAAITSPDGKTLVANEGAEKRWWVVDPATRTSTSVDTPGDCRPQRWLDDRRIVASCLTRRGSQLRAVDLDGTSVPLGVRHTPELVAAGPPIFSDEDVRAVRGNRWYESYGGCGGGVLTRLTPKGEVRIVRVPGRDGALTLVGTRGSDLLLAVQRTECGSWPDRAVLTAFDPWHRTERVLTALGRRESWREVVPATEVRAWIG